MTAFLQSKLHGIGEFLTPVLKASKFKETGVITPEEFIAAGDFLVFKCPTWSWESGEESKRRNFLPPDKQFLVTRNVPCFKRVKSMEYSENDERVVEGDDWVETHIGHESLQKTDLQEIPGDSSAITAKSHASAAKDDDDDDVPDIEDADGDDDDIPDIDEFEEDNLEACDPSALAAPSAAAGDADDNILRTRTYDLYITYDKYYQTPRLWLFGHDESRKPLSVTKMYEDFSQDHAKKTVTMEAHPNLSITMASIHPCRHSNVMKKIISNVEVAGKELGVHLYLMIFLKFVQSVIPTIEYDYTREFSF